MIEYDETSRLYNFELQAMLKRVVHSLGFVENTDNKDSKSKKKGNIKGYKDPQFSSKSKDFVVKIAHAGGKQDVYRHAVPVYALMTKYPGMCIASPEVFKSPHQSVLWKEDLLLPGHKYILISLKDVEKLKRKHPEKDHTKETNGVVEKENLGTKSKSPSNGHKHKENGKMKELNGVVEGMEVDTKMNEYVVEGEVLEDSFTLAKNFYNNPKEKPTKPSRKRGLRPKKIFVPPFPKARQYRSFGWKPSLPAVKELSP